MTGAMKGAEKHEEEIDYWVVPEQLHKTALEVARQFWKEPTRSEALLWEAQRARKLEGCKLRRQQPIGPFIVDFIYPSARLTVGSVHESQRVADANRRQLLESLGFRLANLRGAGRERPSLSPSNHPHRPRRAWRRVIILPYT